MARYGDLNYAWWTKYGFLTGLSLFVLGGAASAVVPGLAGPIPGWERALFLDAEIVGILIGFVSVFGFGIALPLTE